MTRPEIKYVYFLDGLKIRRGAALSVCRGVWRVRCGRELVNVWGDDIFYDFCAAQHAVNLILN